MRDKKGREGGRKQRRTGLFSCLASWRRPHLGQTLENNVQLISENGRQGIKNKGIT